MRAIVLAGVLAVCRAGDEITIGAIERWSLLPTACTGLFPAKGGDPASCANCTLTFEVEMNVSEVGEQRVLLTSAADEAVGCECPQGLSGWIADGDDILVDFGGGDSAYLRAVAGAIELEDSSAPACVAVYNVTEGTVLNITAPASDGVPSSIEVETFAVVLLMISAASILGVFVFACRSQNRGGGYTELDG